MTLSSQLKSQIKLYMDSKGVSQADLARQLNVTPQSINQVLSGTKSGVAKPLEAILDALDLKLTVQPNENHEG